VVFSPSGGLLANANFGDGTVSVYSATNGADLGVSFPASDPTTATGGSVFDEDTGDQPHTGGHLDAAAGDGSPGHGAGSNQSSHLLIRIVIV
jgi:hypothetical protein